MTDRARTDAAAGTTFAILGVVFTVVGLARNLPGLWAPGVAFAAVGSSLLWQARGRRPGS